MHLIYLFGCDLFLESQSDREVLFSSFTCNEEEIYNTKKGGKDGLDILTIKSNIHFYSFFAMHF